MRSERRLLAFHGAGVVVALVAALAWPRTGQAALMVPLGSGDLGTVLRWADREQADLLALDPASGRVVARVSGDASLLSALGAGILPLATPAPSCRPRQAGAARW